MKFSRYIGIDYSGAKTPESRLKGLQVYEAGQEADRRGTLDHYFAPPLTLPERKQAELEGWILGVW